MTTWTEPVRRARPFSQLELATVSAIIVGGAALRIFRLTFQSLWFDELFSVVFSRSGLSVSAIVEKYAGDVHSIGYPLALHLWLRLFGDNDLAARSLSAVWGVLGIAALWLAARRLGGPRLGIVAALLLSVNAYHIAYSQEARSYALVFVFAVFSYLALLVFVDAPGWRRAAVFGATVAVAFHIHYYALVMFFGQIVAATVVLVLTKNGWRDLRYLVVAGAVVVLGMLPWIGPFLRVAGFDRYWPAVPEPWFAVDYFHTYFGENLFLSLSFGGLLLALPFLLRPGQNKAEDGEERPLRMTATVLALSVVASLAAAYGRSVLAVPMLIPRFTFVLLPAVILLIAVALSRIRPPLARTAVVVAVVAVSLTNLALGDYYTRPRKEQWREATVRVLEDPRFQPGADAILAMYAPGFQYYADQYAPGLVVEEATVEALEVVVGGDRPETVVWLLTARGSSPPEAFMDLLRARFERTDSVGFIATRVERWAPGPGAAATE